MIDRNQMWEIIDGVIAEEVIEAEAVSYGISMSGDHMIYLEYHSIHDKRHVASRIDVHLRTLGVLSVPSLRQNIKEFIGHLRGKAE